MTVRKKVWFEQFSEKYRRKHSVSTIKVKEVFDGDPLIILI